MQTTSTPCSRSSPRTASRASDLFRSAQPLGFAAGDRNLYRYVGNSPTNFTDPTGLEQFPNLSGVDLTEQVFESPIVFRWDDPKTKSRFTEEERKALEKTINRDFDEMTLLDGVVGKTAREVCHADPKKEQYIIHFKIGALPQVRRGQKNGFHLDPTLFDKGFIPDSMRNGKNGEEMPSPVPGGAYPDAVRWIVLLHEAGHRIDSLSLADPGTTPLTHPFGMNLLFENACRDQLGMGPRKTYDGFSPPYINKVGFKIGDDSPPVIFGPGGGQGFPPREVNLANDEYSRLKNFLYPPPKAPR